MTITKVFPSGAYQITDIIGGQLVTRTYYGYTKREAQRQFKMDTKGRTK